MTARMAAACPNRVDDEDGHVLVAHCDSVNCQWSKCKQCRFYGGRWSDKLQAFAWREPVVRGKRP